MKLVKALSVAYATLDIARAGYYLGTQARPVYKALKKLEVGKKDITISVPIIRKK